MKKITILLILFVSFFLSAMSNDPSEDPKLEKNDEVQIEQKSDIGFITKDELNRIAVNYYTYRFSEEHEYKGIIKERAELIKNIIPVKEYSTTIAYIINYNPDGHAVVLAHKSSGPPIGNNGGGHWNFDVKDKGYLSSFESRLNPVVRNGYHKIYKAYKERKNLTTDKHQKFWDKYNVPIDSFKEKADYENNMYKPDWWLEKKKSKNIEGMIKTEWHQHYPFNNDCPVTKDRTVVGCSPLAIAQLMKFYE